MTGLTFQPEDAEGCADAVERFIEDTALRESICLKGIEEAKKRYDIEDMVEKIEKYMLDICP